MRLRPSPFALLLAAVTASEPVFAQVPATPPPAPAAPAPPVNPTAECAAGDKAAAAKDWAGALSHYQAAVQAAPAGGSLAAHAVLGGADALYELGRTGEAFDAYTDAQRTVGLKLGAADRALVAARIKDLTPKTGSLSIHVEEPGADVQLDGKTLGTSPFAAIQRVSVGPHELRVSKTGFVPFVGHADVTADGRSAVDSTPLAPQPSKGHLVVHAVGTDSLRVLVDGVDLGATPWEGDVPAGSHQITGRSSNATATGETVNVAAGDRVAVDLVPAATAAHLQLQTSDGKGEIYIDGADKGQGAFAGAVSPAAHTVVVTREGYERYEKTLTLGERETWAETITLKVAGASATETQLVDRPFEGVYGGFGLLGLFGVGGMGTDLETGCSTLGASSCDTGNPVGGGAFGYVGYTWDPVGFEFMLGASADTASQTAHFGGGTLAAVSPLSQPPRDEKFTFARFGGVGAVRVRASYQGRIFGGTIAGGVGLSYKKMIMKRDTRTTDGLNQQNVYVPGDGPSYLSPAIALEAALHVRVSSTIALAAGLEMWADSASIWGSNDVAPGSGQVLSVTGQSLATPGYHLATGSQVFLGPFLGMQFGP